ncbi:alpha-1,2-mannosidase, putative [Granulicella pectinivorans]|uniref:Alpha-1,2-mannosidase, putative n=1 Tax=Granulicella pectinivorans TaxID=474950 RepID=A0A1I6MYK2_9BACT|nr:GH92 family glycosyl hydrolase [Granulicella pectinivorans]SFS20780.1 alpha-1,2-mannosidase, putative [Granulicella pectinivorans]
MAHDRREFLKGSGLAVLAGLGTGAGRAEDVAVATSAVSPGGRVERVNILQGTDSTSLFSRGNTLPIAAVPFGMAHWTLQSSGHGPWFFQPRDNRLQGFRSTHQLSPWLGDYGQAVFLPFSGEVQADADARAASYRPSESTLKPHTMKMRLMRYFADVELVPTERCAAMEVTFSEGKTRGLLIDVPGEATEMVGDRARKTVRFASTANRGGVPQGFATYYVVRFDRAWAVETKVNSKGTTVATFTFDDAVMSLRVGIGTSFLSYEQAERNLEREIGARGIDEVRSAAAKVWNEHLGRIATEGGTASQGRIFDSCLYRALLFPRVWHEVDGAGKTVHWSPYTGRVTDGVMYADHGYWDVYRAWYPLMSLAYPERLGEILQAWVNAYQEGGWLPQFPCPGYRACMTGSLIDAVFGDAAAKGIKGFDMEAAYAGLKKHAMGPGDPDRGYGRRGIEEYLQQGYCSTKVEQSAAETTDAAYGDFCIGQVARALGKTDDAVYFEKRSGNWRKLFDEGVGFFRAKHPDGSWAEPFDPIRWGDPYVEGAAWQHRFDVPHDVEGMMAAYGGPAKMADALETMLTMAPDFRVGAYGREIHEMSEMAAVRFGQYAHSNQPVHHILYLFTAAGRPDRTQFWVRKVMEELYTEDGFAGDEDTGSMAAWYVLSSMGVYPVCAGKAEYTLGSPLWERVVLRVPGKKETVISARGRGVFVSGVRVNGAAHGGGMISHAALTDGAKVEFSMRG